MAIAVRAMMFVCVVLAVAAAAAGFHAAAVSLNPFIGISGFMLIGFAAVTFWMAVKVRQ
jgi:hypothetical protein